MCFFPQMSLVETAVCAGAGRSVCHTPRCNLRNWNGSTQPINSSRKTKGGGYPCRPTWQRDKWLSGFKTGASRRRKSSINSRVPASSADAGLQEEAGGHECVFTWEKLCHNLLYYMNRSFVDITTLFDLHISFLSFNWNQPVRPVDRRPEVGWDRAIEAFRGGHLRFFCFSDIHQKRRNDWSQTSTLNLALFYEVMVL